MFKILDFTKDNLIAIEVNGKLKKVDYEKLQTLLKKTEKEFEYIKLYIRLGIITGITMEAIIEDFKTYFKHIKEIDKVAIVGNNGIEKVITNLSDIFISAEIKYFQEEENSFAVSWIQS